MEHGEIQEEQFARETLERYSGSPAEAFQSNLSRYVDHFAERYGVVEVYEGSMFKVTHVPGEEISILDFKIGSPAAALVVICAPFSTLRRPFFWGCLGSLVAFTR